MNTVIFVLALIASSFALNCSEQWQCNPVSQDYNYVQCSDGVCQCRPSFDGTATLMDNCRCDSPKDVEWKNGQPYCISYDICVEDEENLDRAELLKQKVRDIYSSFIYPTPLLVLNGTVSVDNLFSPNVKARFVPIGTFDTKDEVIDYFYGLSITHDTITVGYTLREMVADGATGTVIVVVDILHEDQAVIPFRRYNLTSTTKFRFDDTNRVEVCETFIREFGRASDPPQEHHTGLIQFMCGRLLVDPGTCSDYAGDPGYYNDFDDCVDFLTNSVPFGTFDRANSNSVVCRLLYTIMSPHGPTLHCPSTGKTGGSKCVDVDYNDYYLQDY